MKRYFERRIDRPHLWVIVLGALGAARGAVGGFRHQIPEGPFVGACAIGFVGATIGLIFGSLVGLICRLAGGLDRPVRRPDIWAIPLLCPQCGLANQAGWPVESKRLHLEPSVVPVVLTIARGPRAGLSSMRASDPIFRKHLRCDPCRRPASLAAQPTPVALRQNHLQAMRVCIRQVGARGFILAR